MGDMNAGYYTASQQLLREGFVNVPNYGKRKIDIKFIDGWEKTHPSSPNERTSAKTNKRLDYVYIEKTSKMNVIGSHIWDLPGGSDHSAISLDLA